MFFIISKIFWIIAAPLNLLGFSTLIGLLIRFWKKALGNRILIITAWVFVMLGFLPIGHNMLVFIERQYNLPSPMPERVDGIIVLGGAFNAHLSHQTGQIAVNSNVSRMSDFIALSKRYPDAKKVFSGGSGNFQNPNHKEADDAYNFLNMMGLNADEFIYERESRNTFENVSYSKALLNPQKGERWIVITSDFHMPRTMAIFKQLDWDVTAYPSGSKTRGEYQIWPLQLNIMNNYFKLHRSLKEIIGVGVYYLTGKSALFFPLAPIKSDLND